MNRRDRRLERVRAEPARETAPSHQRHPLPRSDPDSRARSCCSSRTSSPVRRPARARRDSCSSIRARSPITSGSGSKSISNRPSRIASPTDPIASRLSRRGRVTLVEHQIDHLEHGIQPIRKIGPRRHLIGDPARPGSSPWRARFAGPPSAGARNARAISSVVRPHTSRSVSATCASGGSAGWQQVKISRSRSSSTPSSSSFHRAEARRCRACRRASANEASNARPTTQAVDRFEPAGRHQPAAGIRRHALLAAIAPWLQARHRAAPPRRDRSRRAGGSAWPVRGATRRDRARRFAGEPARRRHWSRTPLAGTVMHRSCSMIGRTSIEPYRAPGILDATWMASLRSLASTR